MPYACIYPRAVVVLGIYARMEQKEVLKALLPGYYNSLQVKQAKDKYKEKLQVISGLDPYEIPNEWTDDIDLWSVVTHIHIGMYLLNYK